MVAECSQLDVDIIVTNSKLFAKAIATRSAFVPYQKTKSSLKILRRQTARQTDSYV